LIPPAQYFDHDLKNRNTGTMHSALKELAKPSWSNLANFASVFLRAI